MLRHRWLVLGVWIAILLTGGALSADLNKLLSNEFTVPGTDSEHVRTTLEQRFGQRDDGSFLVVFRVDDSSDAATRRELQAGLVRGAAVLEGGRAQPLQTAGRNVVFGTIGSPLDLADAKELTGEVARPWASLGAPRRSSAALRRSRATSTRSSRRTC